jgi:uncharacterized membrane protein YoaK (UPF0700 family)
VLGGVALARIPTKQVFAILAIFPVAVAVCASIIGRFQRRMARRHEAVEWDGQADLLPAEVPARE